MMKKRILSLLLILCMAVTLLPTAVFAKDATGTSFMLMQQTAMTRW